MSENNKTQKFVLLLAGMVLLAGVVIISIIKDRIIDNPHYQISVTGQGKVQYKSDIAIITLGVQIDKAKTAEIALNEMNNKMNQVISELKKSGIKEENIQTQNYFLETAYDQINGVSKTAGYNANQKVTIKAEGIDKDQKLASNIISIASKAGANQVIGIKFDASNLNNLKQEARIKAITDAKLKSNKIAQTTGVKFRKIVGLYERTLQSPDLNSYNYYGYEGIGGGLGGGGSSPAPQLPSGTQEIVMEIDLNYEIR